MGAAAAGLLGASVAAGRLGLSSEDLSSDGESPCSGRQHPDRAACRSPGSAQGSTTSDDPEDWPDDSDIEVTWRSTGSTSRTSTHRSLLEDYGGDAHPVVWQPGDPRPQVVDGTPVWPEYWGITQEQVKALLQRLRKDPLWNQENSVYKLVKDFVIPWTRGQGMGYALLVNQDAPKEVNVMVSHAFMENAEQFLEAVVRATSTEDVLYICALANYQAEDAAGPSIAEQIGEDPMRSPFRRVLEHIRAEGQRSGRPAAWRWRPLLLRLPAAVLLAAVLSLCAPIVAFQDLFSCWFQTGDPSQEVLWWLTVMPPLFVILSGISLWCWRWTRNGRHIYRGRMIVVPNYESDIYSRLWCVYEVFVAKTLGLSICMAPTLALAGKVAAQDAKCSFDQDERRIRQEIEASLLGYAEIDMAVRRTLQGVTWHSLGIWAKYTIIQVVPVCAYALLVTEQLIGSLVMATLSAFYASLTVLAFRSARRAHGVVLISDSRAALLLVLALVVATSIRERLELQAVWNEDIAEVWEEWWVQCMDFVLFEVATCAAAPLVPLVRPLPKCLEEGCRVRTLMCLILLSFTMNTMYSQCYSRDPTHRFVPTMVADLFLSWARVAPVYMVWTESLYFGVQVRAKLSCIRLLTAASWGSLVIWLAGLLRVCALAKWGISLYSGATPASVVDYPKTCSFLPHA